jgi:putative ATPase
MELFKSASPRYIPLADKMRPHALADVIEVPKRLRVLADRLMQGVITLPSLLFWGPPGVGKTTMVRLLADMSGYPSLLTSAVAESMRDVRKQMEQALQQHNTIVLVIDEIHRFNKSQQDAFLGVIETGQVILLGATTENPWSYLNRALLSRLEIVRLHPLSEAALSSILDRALAAVSLTLTQSARDMLIETAIGDARELMKRVEALADSITKTEEVVTDSDVAAALEGSQLLKKSTTNQNDRSAIVSAFIKSLRGSCPDGALYWAFRLLKAGEDPQFLFRRMIIFASEDIGNADPRAVQIAVSCLEGYEKIGEPEGRIILSHCITYLASVPKSNEAYLAYKRAESLVENFPELPVPEPFIPGSRAYKNPHNDPLGFVKEAYLPEKISAEKIYTPGERGFEMKIKEHLGRLWREG